MSARALAVRRWVTGTFTGRALACGALMKLVAVVLVFVAGSSTGLAVLDTVGDVALVTGAVALGYRLYVDAKRQLLWRVRRKLTLSYIFIGFVPVLLIISFFLVCGALVVFNISSYMMRSRVAALVDQTQFLAQTAALELQASRSRVEVAATLEGRYAGAVSRYPSVSYAVIPAPKDCGDGRILTDAAPLDAAVTAGPWAHVPPPAAVPDWIPCDGHAGLIATPATPTDAEAPAQARLTARAIVWVEGAAPRHAVIVDVPLGAEMARRFRAESGVELGEVASIISGGDESGAASRPVQAAAVPGRPRAIGQPDANAGWLQRPLEWVAFLDYTDWETGRPGAATVVIRTSLAGLYDRISATPLARIRNVNFGQMLLILLAVVGGLFLVIQVVAFSVGLALARSITGSIHELFAGTERVRRGDLKQKIAIRSRDQLGELATSFNEMTTSIEKLMEQQAEKERMEQELRIARSIQMSLLPQGPMHVPGLSLAAHCEPAREVGGDYYDFLPIGEHTLGIIIADVSGKGTSAALYMAELKGIVLSLSRRHTSPRELLIEADRIISRHLDARSFITVAYLLVDLQARTLRYARAGHCPLIYMPGSHAAARTPQLVAPDGLVLGLQIDEGQMFERLLDEVTLPLAPGDLFVLYTDGMSEAMNPEGDCFGDSRLADVVGQHPDMPSEELRERILRDVGAFAGSAAQHDDMTMVFLRVDEDDVSGDRPLQAAG
jgi:serine phosphatase RsbU (regulator of sigma subunit)